MTTLLQEAIELIENAHDTHIYCSNDEHPKNCQYCDFVKRAKKNEDVFTDLQGAVGGLLHQVGQMRGMFNDEDGTIQDAVDDGENALARSRNDG